jgi:hypothetical protein
MSDLRVTEKDREFAAQIREDMANFEEGISEHEKLAQWVRNIRHDAERSERERCASIAISFGEFQGERLIKDLRVMCGSVIADKIRETQRTDVEDRVAK